jgi:hypothetical protein
MTEESIESIPTMSATERYIQIAKREDPNKWEQTYALRDAVNEHLSDEQVAAATSGRHGVKTGIESAIADVYQEAIEAGLIELDYSELRQHYRTAVAWPEEMRVEGATYAAHMVLRDLDNRQGRLSKWVVQSTTGHFGRNAARRKKSELGMPASERVEEARPPVKFRRNIHQALKRWSGAIGLTEAERREAVSILHDLINEIEEGEFSNE